MLVSTPDAPKMNPPHKSLHSNRQWSEPQVERRDMLECGHDKPPQFPLLKSNTVRTKCETVCTNGQGEYAQFGLTA